MENTSKQRLLLLLLLLVLTTALFFNKEKLGLAPTDTQQIAQNQQVKNLNLDEELKAEIAKYFTGIEVQPTENSIQFATRLDHGTGRKLMISGKLKDAYPIYQKIMKISFNQGSLMGVGISLGVLSNIMHHMSERDEAIKLAFLEYKVSTALGNRFEYGVTQQRIATLMESQSRTLAMSWRMLARKSLKDTPHKQDYAGLLNNTARDLEVFDHDEEALAVYEEAYQASQLLGKSPEQSDMKLRIVNAYMKALITSNEHQHAIDIGLKAISTMPIDLRPTNLNYNVLFRLGEAYRGLNQPQEASEYYGAAYRFYEESRVNALGDRARAKIDNGAWGLVNNLIDTYIDQKDFYRALALLESNKARTLSDIEDDTNQKGIYSELTELNRLHAKQRSEFFNIETVTLDAVVNEALHPPLVSAKEQIKRYRDLRGGYEELIDRQQDELARLKISSEIRDVAIGQAISAKQIRAMQSKLGKDQAIVSFYAKNKSVGVFLLTPTSIDFHASSLGYRQAIRLVRKLQAALINPHVDLYEEPAKILADELIQPLLAGLSNNITSLFYSTDSNFADIPIGVLPVANQYLAQRFSITRVPSLRLLELNDKTSRTNVSHGISCVDPDIAYARLVFQRETAKKLQQLYGNALTSLMGINCSANNLEQAIRTNKSSAFLHLGAHGNFYKTRSMDSGLLLSPASSEESFGQGSIWDARAIGAVDLSAIDLVTIASREAALTDISLRRDLFGLMRTLLFSGVKNVVAPLWATNEQATNNFMKFFYGAYKNGLTPTKAAQQAQLKLINSKQYSHPFYWSSFVVTEVSQ